MADEISQIVEVYITRETAQVDTASFNIPLLLVDLPDVLDPVSSANVPADVTERVRVFSSTTAVSDTFGADSSAYKMAVKLMGGQTRPAAFMIGVKNSEESYAEAVNACVEYNGAWYMVAIESVLEDDIKEVAEVVQSMRRMFAAATADAGVIDPASTTDIGSFLKATDYDRTFLVYHTQAAEQFPQVAWMGGQITAIPGSNTWAFKGAPGVTSDRLSGTAINTLNSKNVNYFNTVGGINMFRNGNTCQGEWIDTMIFLDWLQARIQEQIFYRVATKSKIPYTAAGAAIIESEIRSVLSQGVQNGGIADAPSYQVQSPDVLSVPEVQRAQRILGDFRFQARLAGAVHRITVRGVVGY